MEKPRLVKEPIIVHYELFDGRWYALMGNQRRRAREFSGADPVTCTICAKQITQGWRLGKKLAKCQYICSSHVKVVELRRLIDVTLRTKPTDAPAASPPTWISVVNSYSDPTAKKARSQRRRPFKRFNDGFD